MQQMNLVNTLRSRQNGWYFADYIFQFENGSDNVLAPKKWDTITWTNGHLDYWRIYVSPGLNEWTHAGLVTHVRQRIWQSVAYFTEGANRSLAKPPLKFSGGLAKLGLTSSEKKATAV